MKQCRSIHRMHRFSLLSILLSSHPGCPLQQAVFRCRRPWFMSARGSSKLRIRFRIRCRRVPGTAGVCQVRQSGGRGYTCCFFDTNRPSSRDIRYYCQHVRDDADTREYIIVPLEYHALMRCRRRQQDPDMGPPPPNYRRLRLWPLSPSTASLTAWNSLDSCPLPN